MRMPPPDNAILSRRNTIAEGLRRIVGEAHVMDDEASLKAYETDALSAYRQDAVIVGKVSQSEKKSLPHLIPKTHRYLSAF